MQWKAEQSRASASVAQVQHQTREPSAHRAHGVDGMRASYEAVVATRGPVPSPWSSDAPSQYVSARGVPGDTGLGGDEPLRGGAASIQYSGRLAVRKGPWQQVIEVCNQGPICKR